MKNRQSVKGEALSAPEEKDSQELLRIIKNIILTPWHVLIIELTQAHVHNAFDYGTVYIG